MTADPRLDVGLLSCASAITMGTQQGEDVVWLPPGPRARRGVETGPDLQLTSKPGGNQQTHRYSPKVDMIVILSHWVWRF